MSCARLAVLGLVGATLIVGCGGGGSDDASEGPPRVPAGHEAVGVIEGWVETLAAGDEEGAADYFAIPSVVENGTPPITLHSHAEAVAFNRALPCGAKLLKARPVGRVIAATFRLRERPGGDCGSGSGQLARTAFVIRDQKIVQWRRLPNPPGQDGGGEPIV